MATERDPQERATVRRAVQAALTELGFPWAPGQWTEQQALLVFALVSELNELVALAYALEEKRDAAKAWHHGED